MRCQGVSALIAEQHEGQLAFIAEIMDHIDKWPEDQMAFDTKRKQLANLHLEDEYASQRNTESLKATTWMD